MHNISNFIDYLSILAINTLLLWVFGGTLRTFRIDPPVLFLNDEAGTKFTTSASIWSCVVCQQCQHWMVQNSQSVSPDSSLRCVGQTLYYSPHEDRDGVLYKDRVLVGIFREFLEFIRRLMRR